MIPTLDGQPIFQQWCQVTTPSAARASYRTSTFGMDGIGQQDGGFRGCRTVVNGTLFGTGTYYGIPIGTGSLAYAEGLIRSYQDTREHVLVDTNGTTWNHVLLIRFQPMGRIGQTPSGVMYRKFACDLLHLA